MCNQKGRRTLGRGSYAHRSLSRLGGARGVHQSKMSRRNELRVQLSLSRVGIRIASAPGRSVLLLGGGWAPVGWAPVAHLGLRMGSWGRSSGPSGAIFGARPPVTTCLLLGSGRHETGELQGSPLRPSGGHGTLGWEGGKKLQRFQIDDSVPELAPALPQLVKQPPTTRRDAPSFTTAILIPDRSPRCRRKRSCRSPQLCRSLSCTTPRSEAPAPRPQGPNVTSPPANQANPYRPSPTSNL